jgi:hypothetical protein|tara:strand:+ start:65588 stop:65887 length:300 start_codon:yes stop_codon:yes gene_type:complete
MAHQITITVTVPNAETSIYEGGSVRTAMEAVLQASQDAGKLQTITTDTAGLVTTTVATYDAEDSANEVSNHADYITYREAADAHATENGITVNVTEATV